MKCNQRKVKMERRVLHRNLLLPCEVILEEPEGFDSKKEKQNKPTKATSHKLIIAV